MNTLEECGNYIATLIKSMGIIGVISGCLADQVFRSSRASWGVGCHILYGFSKVKV